MINDYFSLEHPNEIKAKIFGISCMFSCPRIEVKDIVKVVQNKRCSHCGQELNYKIPDQIECPFNTQSLTT